MSEPLGVSLIDTVCFMEMFRRSVKSSIHVLKLVCRVYSVCTLCFIHIHPQKKDVMLDDQRFSWEFLRKFRRFVEKTQHSGACPQWMAPMSGMFANVGDSNQRSVWFCEWQWIGSAMGSSYIYIYIHSIYIYTCIYVYI